MYIIKYSEHVHMAEMTSQARASSPYELVPNILRYTFNNLYILHRRVIVMYDKLVYEPRSEKTGLRGVRPGLTQTRLYSYRRWLVA